MPETPASSALGGAVHCAALVAIMHGVIMPLARPKDVKFEKKDGEEVIQLPFRPPLVVMASWGGAFAAREIMKFFAPAMTISRLMDVRPVSVYAAGCVLGASSLALILEAMRVMTEAKTPVPHSAGVAQKLVTSGPFGYFRHPIYVGFIGSTVSLSFLLDCLYRWHCGIGSCMRWHCRIGTCMPFARACPLADACDSLVLMHAILSCMPYRLDCRMHACDNAMHACLHVIVVHVFVAFALASINISTGSMHAFVCVWVCVSVWGLVCLGAHVACCLAPPTCLSCTHIYTYTHAHTHSLVGVGISGGYIVGHVMPVEEEWVRHTL